MKQVIRILVAEKGELMYAGISAVLKQEADILLLGKAKSQEHIFLMCQDKPDLLLLAQNHLCPSLPSLIEQLTKRYPSVKILILSSSRELAFVQVMLRAGAKGYVLSDKSIANLLSAIRAVAAGEEWLSPCLGAKLFIKKFPDLTDQRLSLLKLIGEGKSNQEIALTMQIEVRTVSYHISKIYRALNVNSRASAIRVAIEMNLLSELI